MQPHTPRLLTIDQFTDQFGIGRTKIYQEIKEGRLAAKKVGRRTFIPLQSAAAWLDNLPDYDVGSVV